MLKLELTITHSHLRTARVKHNMQQVVMVKLSLECYLYLDIKKESKILVLLKRVYKEKIL